MLPLADLTTRKIVAELGKNMNVRSLLRGSPLGRRVMGFASSS